MEGAASQFSAEQRHARTDLRSLPAWSGTGVDFFTGGCGDLRHSGSFDSRDEQPAESSDDGYGDDLPLLRIVICLAGLRQACLRDCADALLLRPADSQ